MIQWFLVEKNYTVKESILYRTLQISVYFLFMMYTPNYRKTHVREGFQGNKEVIYNLPLRIFKSLSVHGDDHLLLLLPYKYLDKEKCVPAVNWINPPIDQ